MEPLKYRIEPVTTWSLAVGDDKLEKLITEQKGKNIKMLNNQLNSAMVGQSFKF